MTGRTKVDEATLNLLGSRPAPQVVPSAVLAVDGADVVAACCRFGPRRAFVEVVVGSRVSHVCTVCPIVEVAHGYDLATVRETTIARHAECLAKLGRGTTKDQSPDGSNPSGDQRRDISVLPHRRGVRCLAFSFAGETMSIEFTVGSVWQGKRQNNTHSFIKILDVTEAHALVQTRRGRRTWTTYPSLLAHYALSNPESITLPSFPAEKGERPKHPGDVNRAGIPVHVRLPLTSPTTASIKLESGALSEVAASDLFAYEAQSTPEVEVRVATSASEPTATRDLPSLDLTEFFSQETADEFFLAYEAHRSRVLGLGADIDERAFAMWLLLSGLDRMMSATAR